MRLDDAEEPYTPPTDLNPWPENSSNFDTQEEDVAFSDIATS